MRELNGLYNNRISGRTIDINGVILRKNRWYRMYRDDGFWIFKYYGINNDFIYYEGICYLKYNGDGNLNRDITTFKGVEDGIGKFSTIGYLKSQRIDCIDISEVLLLIGGG